MRRSLNKERVPNHPFWLIEPEIETLRARGVVSCNENGANACRKHGGGVDSFDSRNLKEARYFLMESKQIVPRLSGCRYRCLSDGLRPISE